jgi:hypothetical protein
LNALPILVVFLFRNLLSIPDDQVTSVTDALLDCLADENVEVREMASKAVSGVVRCSQRQRIVPLKVEDLYNLRCNLLILVFAESLCFARAASTVAKAPGSFLCRETAFAAFSDTWSLCTDREFPVLRGAVDASPHGW